MSRGPGFFARTQLEGVGELTGQLTDLGAKVAAKELRASVKKALQVVLLKARANIPKGSEPHLTYLGRLVAPGFAARSLAIKTTLNKRAGSVVARLGVTQEAFYALQFVELGTAKMPARPWLRPAFVASEDAMLQGLAAEMRKRVERIAKKRASGRR